MSNQFFKANSIKSNFQNSNLTFFSQESILLRTVKDPKYVVDWDTFNSLDRNKLQDNFVNEKTNVDKVQSVHILYYINMCNQMPYHIRRVKENQVMIFIDLIVKIFTFQKENVKDPQFDTTIGGPWMNRWEIVHHNKHTAAFKNSEAQSLPIR